MFPAWFLCRNPESSIGVISFASDFAERQFGERIRNIVDRFGQQWFGVRVDRTSSAKNWWRLADHDGQLMAVGIDKALTGRGVDLLIIDDPIQNLEQALSAAQRRAIWDQWQFEIATRPQPKARKVFIMSRWMEDDFLGRLIADFRDRKEPFTLIDLPALALENDPLGRAPGEALWPEARPKEWLIQQRDRIGSRVFDALYQGRPQPEGGAIFRREWFRYYDVGNGCVRLFDGLGASVAAYPRNQVLVFQMIDLATSTAATADYTVVGTFGLLPRRELIVLDIVRARIPGPQQLGLVRALYEKVAPVQNRDRISRVPALICASRGTAGTAGRWS